VSPQRLYAPVVLTTLALGGIAFFAASRTWIHATVRAEGLPSDPVAVSGTDADPIVPALALVVVTAALAVLAASHRVRRVVGVLLVALGVCGAVLVALSGAALDDALSDAVRSSTAFTGGNEPAGDRALVWPVVAGGAFALSAVCGTLVLRFAGRWPTMGRRFEAPQSRTSTPESAADLWTVMDEGRDPTE
jgi:uncharacterized membrane protein (TIGR02234 family)